MAQIIISALNTGTPKGTDEIPAVDITDPSQAASGSTKKYIRSDVIDFGLNAQGVVTYSATRVATTVALSATYSNGVSGVGATLTNSTTPAPLMIDGITLAVNDRVLVKNQLSTFQNGIYIVTATGSLSANWILTRSSDFNTSLNIIQYATLMVNQGTINAGLIYLETGNGPFVIGTTPITFAAYAGTGTGVPVLQNSPTLVTPILGVAAATSINFGGTALHNYVEGVWTPVFTGSGGGSATYVLQQASYTRIGNRVLFDASLFISASTLSGNITITGLPITAGPFYSACNIYSNAMGASATPGLMAFVMVGTNIINLYTFVSGNSTALTATNLGSTATMIISGQYYLS